MYLYCYLIVKENAICDHWGPEFPLAIVLGSAGSCRHICSVGLTIILVHSAVAR